MSKKVLDVGNCSMDFNAIRGMFRDQFQVDVAQAHGPHDALAMVRAGDISLVLVNRKLDEDYSDGLEVIRLLKATPEIAHVPVMLVSNHAEYQEEAVALGATYGFGKKQLNDVQTRQRLAEVLG